MPQALAVTWRVLGDSSLPEGDRRRLLTDFDTILGLNLFSAVHPDTISRSEQQPTPQEVQRLINERETAREQRKFKEADQLRRQLLELGYIVEDSKNGPVVRKIS
jgi:cysteinyl-tRNA synthetase